MRDHFGIGLAGELGALLLEHDAQVAKILDDAVCARPRHFRSHADARCFRSACRGWPSGCGRCRYGPPSGSACSRFSRFLSLPSARRRTRVIAFQRGDACGIVTAIFQAFERTTSSSATGLRPRMPTMPHMRLNIPKSSKIRQISAGFSNEKRRRPDTQ